MVLSLMKAVIYDICASVYTLAPFITQGCSEHVQKRHGETARRRVLARSPALPYI